LIVRLARKNPVGTISLFRVRWASSVKPSGARRCAPSSSGLLCAFYIDPLHPIKRGSPDEAVAIGQFILVRHAAYRTVGGHQAVRGSTAEDVALAKQFRAHSFTTRMINAPDFVESESYLGLAELWEGTTKNLFVVARGRWSTLGATLALEWLSGLIPVALTSTPTSLSITEQRRKMGQPHRRRARRPVVRPLPPHYRRPRTLRGVISSLCHDRIAPVLGFCSLSGRTPLRQVEGATDQCAIPDAPLTPSRSPAAPFEAGSLYASLSRAAVRPHGRVIMPPASPEAPIARRSGRAGRGLCLSMTVVPAVVPGGR